MTVVRNRAQTWKILSFIFLFLISAGSVFGIWIDPYLQKVDLSDVDNIKIVLYRFTGGAWEKTDILRAEYSPAGYLEKETRHNAEGRLQFEYLYTYNEKGEMIRVTGRRVRNEKIVPYKYEYAYDNRGNQIEGIGYGADGTRNTKYTAKYDENNNFIEGTEYREGVKVSKYAAEYNGKSNLIEESKYTVYHYKGEEGYQLDYKHVFSYDDNKNVVEETNYAVYGRFDSRFTYQYDERDNLVEGASYAEDGSVISHYSAKYDEDDNLVKSVHYGPDGNVTSVHKAYYDADSHMVKEIDTTHKPSQIVYLAEYDQAGNLLDEQHFSEKVLGKEGLDYRYSYKYDCRNNRIEQTYYVYLTEEKIWRPVSRQANEIHYKKAD